MSGVPTYTFVTPDKYDDIKVSVRTKGRCLVLEGPSGIGKTTTITKLLEELQGDVFPTVLSARRPADLEYIEGLPTIKGAGVVIVDDFHRLNDDAKQSLSDYMKVLADTEDRDTKLILVGINKSGQQLISFGSDVGLRIDIFRLEANSPAKILELIAKGESALNIGIEHKRDIAERAGGSFQIAQLLCHKLCASAGVLETPSDTVRITRSVDAVIEDTMTELSRQFQQSSVLFARGPKIKRAGRAPYLHLLRWLSETEDGALDIRDAMNSHQDLKGSVGQILDKEFLKRHLEDLDKKVNISSTIFFDQSSGIIGAEDPKYLFFLRNLVWRAFGRKCGFAGDYFPGRYDIALSFAGSERPVAKRLYETLVEHDIQVFHDFAEQHKIAGANVEDYLAPIYRSEAQYVVALLSPEYPNRIWTKVESDHFKDRFGDGSVIGIRYTNTRPGYFSDDARYGGIGFDPAGDVDEQVHQICDILIKKLSDERDRAYRASAEEASNDNYDELKLDS
ncbi:TIR domain-containing protein [Sphingomonas sp.]|uniref:TIR domain-containing protein n=1 Tax=Sphingomonas sp. TaxID=28214 RepID=UPI0035C7B72E